MQHCRQGERGVEGSGFLSQVVVRVLCATCKSRSTWLQHMHHLLVDAIHVVSAERSSQHMQEDKD